MKRFPLHVVQCKLIGLRVRGWGLNKVKHIGLKNFLHMIISVDVVDGIALLNHRIEMAPTMVTVCHSGSH